MCGFEPRRGDRPWSIITVCAARLVEHSSTNGMAGSLGPDDCSIGRAHAFHQRSAELLLETFATFYRCFPGDGLSGARSDLWRCFVVEQVRRRPALTVLCTCESQQQRKWKRAASDEC